MGSSLHCDTILITFNPVYTVKDSWNRIHTLGSAITIIAPFLLLRFIPSQRVLLIWSLLMTAMVIFTMIVSQGVTGRFLSGWLINEQYRMSLSRLQMFLWTVLVMASFMTAILINVRHGLGLNAMNIEIPQELWLAMGISITSLVGSPLILTEKKKKKTNNTEAERTLMMEENVKKEIQAYTSAADQKKATRGMIKEHFSGQLQRNASPKDARFSDLFRGEETSNWNVLDLSRLQNLFFTIVLVGIYATVLADHFSASVEFIAKAASDSALEPNTPPINKFPELNDGFIALLGISHAGYLAGKAVDNQPEGS